MFLVSIVWLLIVSFVVNSIVLFFVTGESFNVIMKKSWLNNVVSAFLVAVLSRLFLNFLYFCCSGIALSLLGYLVELFPALNGIDQLIILFAYSHLYIASTYFFLYLFSLSFFCNQFESIDRYKIKFSLVLGYLFIEVISVFIFNNFGEMLPGLS